LRKSKHSKTLSYTRHMEASYDDRFSLAFPSIAGWHDARYNRGKQGIRLQGGVQLPTGGESPRAPAMQGQQIW